MVDTTASTAKRLVLQRFPDARAAWLGGSAATNSMTAGSDLDITVLVSSELAPFRESLIVAAQPVELFVHTEDSVRLFSEQDRQRRRPTLLRLIGSSIVLLDVGGIGRHLQKECDRLDRYGPPPMSEDEIDAARYVVTDQLGDLSDGGSEAISVAAALWRETAELVLGANARWSGTGMWLQRELQALDGERHTNHANALLSGLAAVGRGEVATMAAAVDAALTSLGGRLFDGYYREGTNSWSPESIPRSSAASVRPAVTVRLAVRRRVLRRRDGTSRLCHRGLAPSRS